MPRHAARHAPRNGASRRAGSHYAAPPAVVPPAGGPVAGTTHLDLAGPTTEITSRAAARHAARHGSAPKSRTALGRPVVVTGAAAALVAGVAGVGGVSGEMANAEVATFAVDSVASRASSIEITTAQLDAERVTAARSAGNSARAVVAARVQSVERAKAAVLAGARKEAAQRAAREAQRKQIIANAQKDPKAVARLLLPEFGFGASQWPCLEKLWTGESDWRWWVANPSSGAYGIPQSLPAKKMASAGSDWKTNPVTQITWGLDYIKKSYGTPCNALDKWESRSPHWY
jgi:hypothetical protein